MNLFCLIKRTNQPEHRFESLLRWWFFLLFAFTISYVLTQERAWKTEAKSMVRSRFPIGTSRARVANGIYSGPRKPSSAPNVEPVVILYHQLQNKPFKIKQRFISFTEVGLEYNAVAVEVYFGSNQKVTHYGSAYKTYIPYIN